MTTVCVHSCRRTPARASGASAVGGIPIFSPRFVAQWGCGSMAMNPYAGDTWGVFDLWALVWGPTRKPNI